MDSFIVKPQFQSNSNYENDCNQALQDLFNTLRVQNFEKASTFTPIFPQLLQYKIDPPLEIIWVYSALAFHASNSSNKEASSKLAAIKDLFQLICSHSASCTSLKSIVLLAPLIFYLYKFIMEFKGFELVSKKEKKLFRDIKNISASILGFLNVCCEALDESFDGSECFTRPLEDLVSIWLWDEEIHNEGQEMVKRLFPLLGEDIAEKLCVGEYGMSELAGHVIAESFLLKCCLAFLGESPGKDFYGEMRIWAVGSLTVMRNSYFFGSLVRMLLQPSLPVASLLSNEDEKSLRKLLYDAVILPEYSFIHLERLAHLQSEHVKHIALDRLVITHEAVQLFRKLGDQSKALSYISAFSSSSFPSQLIKWVKGQMDIDINVNGPNGSSPNALLRWILDIENRGVKIFYDDMSSYRAKLADDNMEEGSKLSGHGTDDTSDGDLLFYIDNKGGLEDENEKDEKINEAFSAAFVEATHSMRSWGHTERKRKIEISKEEKQPKIIKYKLYENSSLIGHRSSVSSDDRSDSKSEVENPSSDEE